MSFKRNYPSPVNYELLKKSLTDAGVEAIYRANQFEVTNAIAEATVDAILTAHNPDDKTTEQQQEADSELTKSEIKDYLRGQLVNPTPNLATIKATIQVAIGSNANIQQAITNIATLYGYDTGTDAGYVRSALLVISIMT